MLRKLIPGMFLILSVVVGLGACGNGGEVGISEPATATLALPSDTATSTPTPLAVPSDTPPATSTPVRDTPTSAPPRATPEVVQPTSTVSAPSPSATQTLPAPPTETAMPSPTSTPTPSTVSGGDPASVRVELQPIASGLEAPLGITHGGDGSGRLLVLEKSGRIRVVKNNALTPMPFLDITDRVGSSQSEQGLLGLAFHPDFANNGFLYVNYTDLQGDTVVSRFAVSGDPDRADPASEMVLLTLPQPAANHNGGNLAFGPDGYLYIGTGDGGAAGDRFGNGQNGRTLLGAMLRLDVDGGQPYAVPPDNPFVGDPDVLDEIWALGLRNPWRYSFDRQTGDLYIADVGQNQYEEVNVQLTDNSGGQNYGWPIMEATHCFPEDRACDPTGLTLPVTEYNHSQGCSVTGGYVYRGQEYPALTGIYLFGDYCSGRIWGLARGDGKWQVSELARVDARISAFGEDEAGELYLADLGGGTVYKITARSR